MVGKERASAIIISTRSFPISTLWSFTPAFTWRCSTSTGNSNTVVCESMPQYSSCVEICSQKHRELVGIKYRQQGGAERSEVISHFGLEVFVYDRHIDERWFERVALKAQT
jgi:hypothetical protein